MKCDFYEEKIMEYLDGELDLRKKEDILRHISGCSRCSDFLAAMRLEYTLLSELPLLSPTPDFTQKVMSSIRNKKAVDYTPKESILPSAVLAFSALALYILEFWNPEQLIFTMTGAVRWFVVIARCLGNIFDTTFWMMDFTAKLFTHSQTVLVFLERVLSDILGEYPLGVALIAALSLAEVFLWGRLLYLRKS